MDDFLIQLLNGLDRGAAYALIALGLILHGDDATHPEPQHDDC